MNSKNGMHDTKQSKQAAENSKTPTTRQATQDNTDNYIYIRRQQTAAQAADKAQQNNKAKQHKTTQITTR